MEGTCCPAIKSVVCIGLLLLLPLLLMTGSYTSRLTHVLRTKRLQPLIESPFFKSTSEVGSSNLQVALIYIV